MLEPTMRELYHVSLDSAEELRTELIGWFERQMAACATFAAQSRLAKDRHHYESQRLAYGDALHFWRNIRIDSKKGTEP